MKGIKEQDGTHSLQHVNNAGQTGCVWAPFHPLHDSFIAASKCSEHIYEVVAADVWQWNILFLQSLWLVDVKACPTAADMLEEVVELDLSQDAGIAFQREVSHLLELTSLEFHRVDFVERLMRGAYSANLQPLTTVRYQTLSDQSFTPLSLLM